jgi:hypothetical protein
LGDNTDTIKKNTETLTDASKKVGIEVNADETKYMLLSRPQNSGQNHNIKIGERSFENVAEFKYLGTTVTNQNLIQKEIRSRLNSSNACYHSVLNLLSSQLLSKNVIIEVYKTVLLPLVLHGYVTCSVTLREVHRLTVFRNNVLRRIFEMKRDEMVGGWRKMHNKEHRNL